MGNVILRFPDAFSATVSYAFSPALMWITHKPIVPIQTRRVAVNGAAYVTQLSTNRIEQWEVRFRNLKAADTSAGGAGGGGAGWNSLYSFFNTTVSWGLQNFDLTDPDSNTITCRYWGGLEQTIEGGGENDPGRAGEYFGGFTVLKKVVWPTTITPSPAVITLKIATPVVSA